MNAKLIRLCFGACGLLFSSLLLSAETAGEPVRVACVGDSITYGAGIRERDEKSYPAQLQALLGDGYLVENFGVSGATLLKEGNKPYWKLKAFTEAREFQPDLVIIKLGTNDSKPGNWKHADQFKPNYIELIESFRALDSQPAVVICRPVPVFATRWGINNQTVVEEVIPRIEAVAEATGVKLVDLYAPLEGKPELVPDKVHPNAEGAGVIAETLHKVVESMNR
jgi:lysophospholipase L1-like esterase